MVIVKVWMMCLCGDVWSAKCLGSRQAVDTKAEGSVRGGDLHDVLGMTTRLEFNLTRPLSPSGVICLGA